ncbi:MAG: hypothetical protein IKK07_02460 [Bacteroides sp.]|nr:hypothetical protein [Bacteroides sp.]
MKIKSYLAVIALMACGSVFAQDVTKADVDKLENQINALSQKVAQLETNLERVITENVNLVEQLNIKTVTSVTDKNGVQWDIVKVEPNADTNDVVLTLRLTNKSGVMQKVSMGIDIGVAVDSDSNRNNNVYVVKADNSNPVLSQFSPDIPVNIQAIIKGVPLTSSHMAVIRFNYGFGSSKVEAKFTGVHIPW